VFIYVWYMQVLHLESSNAAMAEDLLSKTAIIQHYTMETKSGNSTYHTFWPRITIWLHFCVFITFL